MMENVNASRTGAGLLLRGPLPRIRSRFIAQYSAQCIAHAGLNCASGVWLNLGMSREHFAT